MSIHAFARVKLVEVLVKPQIEWSKFGSITIEGKSYDHDIIIRLDGAIHKREKKLSKMRYGTSHKISREEIGYVFEEGAKFFVIGTGQFDRVRLLKKSKKVPRIREVRCSAGTNARGD
jgi:hypothetical protein